MYHAGVVGGAAILVDAIVMAHAPGQYSRIVPIGLSSRRSRIYGCIFLGKRSTQEGGSAGAAGAAGAAVAAAGVAETSEEGTETGLVEESEEAVGTFGGCTVEF